MKNLMTTTATVLAFSTAGYGVANAQAFSGYTYDQAVNLYASDLLGSRIYATEVEVGDMVEPGAELEWDDLGEINDMILTREGQVDAVILGVGGFLGIGERDVAVTMSEIQIVRDGEGPTDYFLVVNAAQQDIENAPAFERLENATEGTLNETAAATGAAVGAAAGTVAAVDNQTNTTLEAGDPVADTDTAAVSTDTQTVPITEDTVTGDVNDTADASAETAPIVSSDTTAASELATNDVEAELAEDTEGTDMAQATVPATEGAVTEGEGEGAVGGDTALMGRPTMQMEGYTELAMDQLTAEDLEGASVYGANDEDVGSIGELLLAADGTTIDQAVIDVGGFLGLGVKQIAVPFSELQVLRSDANDTRVYINATEESLEAMPEYEM